MPDTEGTHDKQTLPENVSKLRWSRLETFRSFAAMQALDGFHQRPITRPLHLDPIVITIETFDNADSQFIARIAENALSSWGNRFI
ncbi:hypothetical protein M3I54_08815 [Paraburkholderia sp. CNPSo 3274]|uniref:hypothetical protein n=1 Tax=Paraburkholderia sp. CNPSo 3274 TaxID=2940932 RepID=UPI0020B66B6A|nr:hypothetical protein [Paraburkholderia sp. CNPSo 3274]MCP3707083.1 hypothetical protein [Paraburkholderia sp. CNPSo 3274]